MQLTAQQYAKKRGITKTAVIRSIKNNWSMPGITSAHQLSSGHWLLTFDNILFEKGINISERNTTTEKV